MLLTKEEEEEIEALGMESFLSVARAAQKRPRFIVMRYMGNPQKPEESDEEEDLNAEEIDL